MPTLPPQPGQPALPAPPTAQAPARVGLLLPMSGSAATLGQDLQDAAHLALFDLPQASIELLQQDTGGTPTQAVAAARSTLAGGAKLLIGPLFGRATSAVAPLAAPLGVGVLSLSNDADVARPGSVYVLGFRPEEQIERVVGYAARQGLGRIALLAPDDAYGARAIAAWRAAVARIPGASAAAAATYPAEGGDLAAAVRRVAAVGRPSALLDQVAGPEGAAPAAAEAVSLPPPGFDALLIADGGARLQALAPLLAQYQIGPGTVRLLGTMRWQDDPAVASEPGLRGAWLATWPPEAIEAFLQRFEAVYGRQPARLAVLAYDATALAGALAAEEGGFTAARLADPQGFIGGAGIFRLRPDGLADHGLAVVELDGGAARTVDPAPQSFTNGIARR
jgi:ABC-type branched-subunit amino acid transport system substrate-binding protein